MKKHADIVIIGAGIMGSSLAYFLSKRGKDVVVLEKNEICSGTSSSTAAWLWPSDKRPECYGRLAKEGYDIYLGLEEELGTSFEMTIFGSVDPAKTEEEMEAALSIGLTKRQAYLRIIIPQALTAALPNICNTAVSLLKSTSLAFMMTVKDITAIAKIDASFGYNYLEAYLVIFFVYILLCTLVQLVFHVLERNVASYKKLITA